MGESKKTIKRSIFISQISVIIVSLLMTDIAFNICLNIYIKSQAKTQMIAAASLLQREISADLADLNIEQGIKRDDRENIKALLKINRTLKQTQFLLDINYAVIGKDKNQIFPLYSGGEDSLTLRQDILPALRMEKWDAADSKKNSVVYFTAGGKRYASLVHPMKLQNAKNIGYLFLYSDLSQSRRLVFIVNIILFFILLVTALIAFIISNTLSKKISYPISELSKFAKQIGDREYSCPPNEFSGDEIGELGRTMKSMADKLFAYDNAMKTFLQNASHELRTPLMSIQGYAEGIKYDVVENRDSAIEIIIEESKRLSKLVEDLLYLSKMDSTHEELKRECINGENLLKSCIERVNGIALECRKAISLDCEGDIATLNVDEEKFSRAIINILANSLRYAEHSIDITLKRSCEYAVIEIRDDGCGFDEKDIDRVFDRFYKGNGGKHGLGLTLAKSIIERHDGTIEAGNNKGRGAYFRIVIPYNIIT